MTKPTWLRFQPKFYEDYDVACERLENENPGYSVFQILIPPQPMGDQILMKKIDD